LKTKRHFENRFLKRPYLRREWCERAIRKPIEIQEQENGYWRFWIYIAEVGKYLRVVTLHDKETIETAHFDRNYARRR
jgi:hypothetical protein